MTEEQQTLLVIKGTIADLQPSEQLQVTKCLEVIRKLLAENEPYGHMALALVGAEIAAT